jgi:NADH:ubiquinone oxidoreductase subunit 4 (subunit M)
MLVGAYYQMFMTRLILILRGILLATPLLAFLAVLLFTLNVPVPPYPSFFAEVCIFLCVFHTTSLSLIFIFLLSLLVIVYSLFWFVSTSFGSPSVHKPQEILSLSNSLSFFSYITPSLSFILILTLL